MSKILVRIHVNGLCHQKTVDSVNIPQMFEFMRGAGLKEVMLILPARRTEDESSKVSKPTGSKGFGAVGKMQEFFSKFSI